MALDLSQRAARVARSQGRTPTFLLSFSETEVAAIADLADENGSLAEGVAEKFAAIVAQHNDALADGKATDAETETEIDAD